MANPWDNDPVVDPFEDALKAEGLTGKAAEVARSIYQQESSSGKNTKTSNAGAVGGMQIIPATFKSVADKGWDINDPTQNARAGIRYVKQLFDQAGGDPALTAAGYYGGPGGLEKARRGVAVSDPRNPNAPTTIQYGQQVAARIPKEKGLVQRGVEAVIPSANAAEFPAGNPWDNDPIIEAEIPRVEVLGTSKDEPGILDKVKGGVRAVQQYQKDMVGGAVRGAGSIGATLIRPFESAEENQQRRKDIDAGLSSLLGSNSDSIAYQGSKLGAELAGTAGAGGVIGNTLRLGSKLPVVGNALSRLGTAAESGGMSVGPGGNALANLLTRSAGGSMAGGAQATMIDPNLAGTGAIIGGIAGPAVSLAGRVGGGVVGGARAIRDTVTQGGQQRIAENILRLSATNPEAAAAALARAKPLVPGSTPTAGQAAVDPGIAQLERTLVNNPATAPGLQTRYAQQRAARGAAIDEVAATGPNSGSYYDDIKAGRDLFAKEDYDAARQAGIDPEMAASMQAEIASLMGRPSIKAASAEAKRLAAETGEEITDMGSVQGMDWLRKALSNQISKAKASGAAEDVRALTKTYQDLGATLEQLAPKYAEANRNYAAMSKQINSMDVARDLEKRYTPAAAEFGQSAQEQGAAYMKALKAAQDSVKKSTGRDQALGDVMSTPDIAKLENVAKDLARKQYSQEAGRAVGSPTAQNLISQNFIQQIMEGAGLPASAAMESTLLNTMLRPLQFAGRLAEPRVNNRLAELMLDPEAAAAALKNLPPAQRNEALKLLSNAAPGASIPRIELRGRVE